jgi:hypothetical protein
MNSRAQKRPIHACYFLFAFLTILIVGCSQPKQQFTLTVMAYDEDTNKPIDSSIEGHLPFPCTYSTPEPHARRLSWTGSGSFILTVASPGYTSQTITVSQPTTSLAVKLKPAK